MPFPSMQLNARDWDMCLALHVVTSKLTRDAAHRTTASGGEDAAQHGIDRASTGNVCRFVAQTPFRCADEEAYVYGYVPRASPSPTDKCLGLHVITSKLT